MESVTTRLLVVGGTGFIGRHVVAEAVRRGWDVTSLSLHAGHPKTNARVKNVAADITDRNGVKSAVGDARFEYVVNCGGYIDHASFSKGGRSVFDAHFGGVVSLVETLDRGSLRSFVNIGSSDEYGDGPAPQSETQRESPISPYSMGKAAATQFLQMLFRSEGFPAITVRLFLTYGPGQDERRFVPQIIRGCLDDKTFAASEGKQLRDFCFIDDTVAGIFAALEQQRTHGEVINIASGQPVSIRSVVETIRTLVGKGDPRYGEIAYRTGENMALYADVAKARKLLGWTPTTPFEAGLERTIDWMRKAG
jgi:nucleoside-diphosphate-sugar epimerase